MGNYESADKEPQDKAMEIKKHGDTVYIRSIPTMTIRDYVKGQNLVNEQPESTATTLVIDKGKYWSFVSDDLDKVQTDLKNYVTQWANDGARQIEIAIDTNVLANVPTDVHASNTGATAGVVSQKFSLGTTASPLSVTKANILDYIVDMRSVLEEQNAWKDGAFLVLPPRMCGLIKKSDLKDASLTGDDKSPLRTGSIGSINGFNIFCSNLLASASTYTKCIFGTKDAITFATQLVETKVQDNPNGFGMLHRGLNVFGYKVVKPEALGLFIAEIG